MHTYTHTHIHMHTHKHIHTQKYTHIHMYIDISIHTYSTTHKHTYTQTHIHTYSLTHIHTYMHRASWDDIVDEVWVVVVPGLTHLKKNLKSQLYCHCTRGKFSSKLTLKNFFQRENRKNNEQAPVGMTFSKVRCTVITYGKSSSKLNFENFF